MNETQESISLWAEETFGPVGSNARVAARANEEMAELLRALSTDDSNPKAAEEAADVVIVLCRLAHRLETRLPAFGYDFGKEEHYRSNYRIAAQANFEMAHLLRAVGTYTNDTGARSRVIQVCGYMGSLALRMGFSLKDEVDKKMAINRARQWHLDNTGHGYHVRDESAGGISQRG
jgi:hypothetical protein